MNQRFPMQTGADGESLTGEGRGAGRGMETPDGVASLVSGFGCRGAEADLMTGSVGTEP